MRKASAGLTGPEVFNYSIQTRHGNCRVNGLRRHTLEPDIITEIFGSLAAAVADLLPNPMVCDVGFGSAAFDAAVVMHSENPGDKEFWGIDSAKGIARGARSNFERACKIRGITPRLHLSRSNLVDELRATGRKADVLYANLPYLMYGEQVRPQWSDAPEKAMYGTGPDGLGLIKELLLALPEVLSPDGMALVRTPQDLARASIVRSYAMGLYGQTQPRKHITGELGHALHTRFEASPFAGQIFILEDGVTSTPEVNMVVINERRRGVQPVYRNGAGLVFWYPISR
jgi:methylase of polypeptide subunit release factors